MLPLRDSIPSWFPAAALVVFLCWPLPAAETPPAEKDEPAKESVSKPDAQAAAVRWLAARREWMDVLTDLRALRMEHQFTEPEELEDVGQQYQELLEKGRATVRKLRAATMAAYLAAPNEDPKLTKFMVHLATDDLRNDRYEAAAELAGILLEKGCREKQVADIAGIAAFVTNDFEAAEKHLLQAAANGSLTEQGEMFFPSIKEYIGLWKKEVEIRRKEAEADDLPRVRLTTDQGEIVVELFENEAPQTVGNFVSLVKQGFYNGLTFHRVRRGVMAEGGCPDDNGRGGPGYKIYCECDEENHRKHFRGTLSMDHNGTDTGGSRFFLTFVPAAGLNGRNTAFGRVIEGMEVLSKIQRINPQGPRPQPDPSKIIKAEVIRQRDHEYAPTKVTN